MIAWFAETTLVALALAIVAFAAGRAFQLGPAARHLLWVVVLVKLISPPLLRWPWSIATTPQTPSVVTVDSSAMSDGLFAAQLPELDAPAVVAPSLEEAAIQALLLDDAPGELGHAPPSGETAAQTFWHWFDMRWLVRVWAAGTAVMAARQAVRVVRFARLVKGAAAVPEWLLDELDEAAARVGVRAPELRVVPGGGSPVLWCLARPMLVVPARVLEGLDRASWRGIFAHELAHLKRGDAWVSRFSLVAAAIWWWNPVYWLVARRLEHEAELACDAWAVAACGDQRRRYAETLVEVCSLMSVRAVVGRDMVPALGIGTAADGRFLERRLTMILKGGAMKPESLAVKFGAAALVLLSTPMWSVGQSAPVDDDAPKAEKPMPPVPPVPPLPPEIADEPEEAEAPRAREARRPQAPEREARELDAARQAAERAMQEAMRMREVAEARAQEAQARFQEVQRRFQERAVAIQDKAEQNTREALELAEQAIAKAAEDAAAEGGSGEEVRERVVERTRSAREALRAAQVRSRENTARDRQRLREEMQRAEAEVAEVEARSAAEGRARRAPVPPRAPAEVAVPARAPMRAVPARIVERRAPDAAVERLEHRLDELERKLDALVDELRAQRSGGGLAR